MIYLIINRNPREITKKDVIEAMTVIRPSVSKDWIEKLSNW